MAANLIEYCRFKLLLTVTDPVRRHLLTMSRTGDLYHVVAVHIAFCCLEYFNKMVAESTLRRPFSP